MCTFFLSLKISTRMTDANKEFLIFNCAMSIYQKISSLFFILSFSSTGFSEDPPWWPGNPPQVPAEYSGLARLIGCSGVLIDVGGPPTAPAYVITNGHCVGFPPPGEIWKDKSSYEEISFVSSTTHKKVNFLTQNIDYATMTGSDIALIKLNDESIGSLKKKGVLAIPLAKNGPELNDEVIRADIKSGFQIYRCTVEAIVDHLQEGEWHFSGSFRHSCTSSGGTSGSPIISAQSGKIVAIHNTSVNRNNSCGVSAACEIDSEGKATLYNGKKYAQRTHDLANCFNAEGIFDLNQVNCSLAKP